MVFARARLANQFFMHFKLKKFDVRQALKLVEAWQQTEVRRTFVYKLSHYAHRQK